MNRSVNLYDGVLYAFFYPFRGPSPKLRGPTTSFSLTAATAAPLALGRLNLTGACAQAGRTDVWMRGSLVGGTPASRYENSETAVCSSLCKQRHA